MSCRARGRWPRGWRGVIGIVLRVVVVRRRVGVQIHHRAVGVLCVTSWPRWRRTMGGGWWVESSSRCRGWRWGCFWIIVRVISTHFCLLVIPWGVHQ